MKKDLKNKAVVISFSFAIALFFILCLVLPKDEFSMSERRKLAEFPEVSFQNIISGKFMTQFQKYSVDSFPFRDTFRRIKAESAKNIFLKSDNNGLYASDGFLSKVEYPLKEDSLKRAGERFKFVVDSYLPEGHKAYLSIIPDKNYFMAQESGHLSMDYEKLVEKMKENTPLLQYIDIFPLLSLDDYYSTDTHWRQEKILPVAEKLAEDMGVTLHSSYEEKVATESFEGVYKGQSALPFASEKLSYLTNDVLQNAKVTDYQNNREIPVYDLKKAEGKDPYEIFLGGPLSIVTMENEKAETERELVIIRDSFGSSLSPLLLSGYSKITVVDIRYIMPSMLSRYVDFSNADMLFIYSTMVLNNSDMIK